MKNPRTRSGAVRRGQLEVTLEVFNREMAQKVASSLVEYHTQHVEPRLKELEWKVKPWWTKLWVYLGLAWKKMRPPPPPKPLFDGGEHVETTEIGAKHFAGNRASGVVVSATDATVTVRLDRIIEEPQVWSPSVWQRIKEPKEEGFVQGDPTKTE